MQGEGVWLDTEGKICRFYFAVPHGSFFLMCLNLYNFPGELRLKEKTTYKVKHIFFMAFVSNQWPFSALPLTDVRYMAY